MREGRREGEREGCGDDFVVYFKREKRIERFTRKFFGEAKFLTSAKPKVVLFPRWVWGGGGCMQFAAVSKKLKRVV